MNKVGGSLSLALLLLLVVTAAAMAHSRPTRFDPAPGAVLDTAPVRVQAWFTSEIRRDPNWSFLQVTDAQGNRVDVGELQLSTDRLSMTVDLRAGLAAGRYLVTWRTYDDSDGEIFGDCYTIFIGQDAADAAVSAKQRLDGGSNCQRIEVSTQDGTPVPGTVPSAVDHAEDETEASDGTDVPLWVVMLAVAGGIAVGIVGGRVLVGNGRA